METACSRYVSMRYCACYGGFHTSYLGLANIAHDKTCGPRYEPQDCSMEWNGIQSGHVIGRSAYMSLVNWCNINYVRLLAAKCGVKVAAWSVNGDSHCRLRPLSTRYSFQLFKWAGEIILRYTIVPHRLGNVCLKALLNDLRDGWIHLLDGLGIWIQSNTYLNHLVE